MTDVPMNFLKSFLTVIAVVIISGLMPGALLLAQEETVVAEVNYDDQQPGYSFGLAYGGYKLRGDEEMTSLSDMISFSTKTISRGGNGGAAIEASLDKSKLEIPTPAELDYAYMAVGAGINGKSKIGPIKKVDLADFTVTFDAKVLNARPMAKSHVEVIFVTSDGKGPTEDEDKNDDQLCRLSFGGAGSTDQIELTKEFQSFEMKLSDMTIESGSLADIEKYEAEGVVLVIFAEDTPANFGIEGDTKLIVDNFRLTKK